MTVLFFTYHQELVADISHQLQGKKDDSLVEAIDSIIHVLVKSFQSRMAVRSAMLAHLIASSLPAWSNDLDAISTLIQDKLSTLIERSELDVELNPMQLYVLMRSVFAVLQRAMLEQSDHLLDPDFEKQLVRLV